MYIEDCVEEKIVGDYTIKIYPDENAESPREWDNLTKMICFHTRYNLGDEHDYKFHNYTSWKDMKDHIVKDENVALIQPLYLFDHSGISISTSDFGDRWDSGMIGFVLISKEIIRKNEKCKRVTQKLLEKYQKYLEGEVETYDQYLRGDVYGFKILDKEEEEIDSCFGYYGTESAIEEAESIIKYLIKKIKKYKLSLVLCVRFCLQKPSIKHKTTCKTDV